MADKYRSLVAKYQTEMERAEAEFNTDMAALEAARKAGVVKEQAQYDDLAAKIARKRDDFYFRVVTPDIGELDPDFVSIKDAQAKSDIDTSVQHPLENIRTSARRARDEISALGSEISRSLGGAIAYGDDLGDALVNSFRRIEAEYLSQGIDKIFQVLIGAAFKNSPTAGGSMPSFGGGGFGYGLPGFAGGTSSTPGGPYLVGERGPEIMYGRGLGVLNTSRTRQALASAGQGNTATVMQFDLRGAVMTQDLLGQMNQMSKQAALTGARGGAALGQVRTAKRARRSLSNV